MMIIDASTAPATLAEFEAAKAEFQTRVELENYRQQIKILQARIAELEQELDTILHMAAGWSIALSSRLDALKREINGQG